MAANILKVQAKTEAMDFVALYHSGVQAEEGAQPAFSATTLCRAAEAQCLAGLFMTTGLSERLLARRGAELA